MREILDSINDAVYTVDPNWRLTYLNRRAEQLWQKPRRELLGRLLWDLFDQSENAELYRMHQLAARERKPVSFETFSPNLGTWVEVQIYPRSSGLSVCFLDIEKRKKAEDSLELALEAANMSTWDLDLKTQRIKTTLHHNQLFGYDKPVRELKLALFQELVVQEDWEQFNKSYTQALESGQFRVEMRVRRPDGQIRWVYGRGRVYYDEGGTPVRMVGVMHDITERKQAEKVLRQLNESLELQVEERTQQVRSLITQLVISEQAERRRISQILHDDLQQYLYGLQFQLVFLRSALNGALQENERIDALRTVDEIDKDLHLSIQKTRSLSVALSPPVLEGEGLTEAVRWLTVQMKEQHGLVVDVRAGENVPTPQNDLRVLLFQIVRELLFNIVKHAGVSQAQVSMRQVDGKLQIDVVDNGVGFDTEMVLGEPWHSHGLYRIMQRLELIGGNMHIESNVNQGTHVTLVCPVDAAIEVPV